MWVFYFDSSAFSKFIHILFYACRLYATKWSSVTIEMFREMIKISFFYAVPVT